MSLCKFLILLGQSAYFLKLLQRLLKAINCLFYIVELQLLASIVSELLRLKLYFCSWLGRYFPHRWATHLPDCHGWLRKRSSWVETLWHRFWLCLWNRRSWASWLLRLLRWRRRRLFWGVRLSFVFRVIESNAVVHRNLLLLWIFSLNFFSLFKRIASLWSDSLSQILIDLDCLDLAVLLYD